MGRPAGTSGEDTLEAIREAGARMIYERGYHATNMRDLAAEVGIQAPSLYNHVRTKQDLLFGLLSDNLRQMLDGVDEALADVQGPRARLESFIAFHLTYHTGRREKALICSTELRSLDPQNLKAAVALRDAYEQRLEDILSAGAASGEFRVGDLRVATMGLLAMLTGAAAWYRPGGRLGRAALISEYTRLALYGVGGGARVPRGRRARAARGGLGGTS